MRTRLFDGSESFPSDVLRSESSVDLLKTYILRNQTEHKLVLFFTVEKPNKSPQRISTTRTRYFSPRVYVYMDQLILRQTRIKDTGIYTCMYRGRPRIVWAVTVLAAGVELYRQTIAPMVYLNTNETDTDTPQTVKTLGSKTIIPANIQVRPSRCFSILVIFNRVM